MPLLNCLEEGAVPDENLRPYYQQKADGRYYLDLSAIPIPTDMKDGDLKADVVADSVSDASPASPIQGFGAGTPASAGASAPQLIASHDASAINQSLSSLASGRAILLVPDTD